jgi:long-subunit acyl-CoA synthetase (AMP-forming)
MTGDIGQFNFVTGELEIIDRMKNAVKLSQGEFVQLSQIEQVLCTHEYLQQCYLYAQSYMSASVAVLQVRNGELKINTRQAYLKYVRDINNNLQKFCRSNNLKGFQIPKFAIVYLEEWTPENSLLTPAMKVRRGECLKKFGGICAAIYDMTAAQRDDDVALWDVLKGII